MTITFLYLERPITMNGVGSNGIAFDNDTNINADLRAAFLPRVVHAHWEIPGGAKEDPRTSFPSDAS